MIGKERIRALLNGEPADRVGFWLGNPTDEAKQIYCRHFGISTDTTSAKEKRSLEDTVLLATKAVETDIELSSILNCDFFWCSPELDPLAWKHPEGKPMFDVMGGQERESLGQPGIIAECENVKEIEAFDWPNPDYLDFSSTIATVDRASEQGMSVFGGMWMPFFHIVAFFLGMENYFLKMYTHPKVVEAITEKVLDFYLEANRRCLDAMAPKLDAVFFGNDLGSQEDLLISPDAFNRFVLPGYRKIVEQAKSYDLKVILHSCGAISKIIPQIIDIGIDGLHPLQAKARGMEAEKLAKEYKGKLLFIGGVDTQQLLPNGTPEQVSEEVRRLKGLFGEKYIVSPSHEALLPNVSIENVLAMRDAAIE
jgi:uroporphyrinogen decarboxylase